MSSDEQQHQGPAVTPPEPELDVTAAAPGGVHPEAASAYEAFEARAAALHGDPTTAAERRDAEAGGADPPPVGVDADAGTGEAASGGLVDDLREGAVSAAKGLAGLHLSTTDFAARTVSGIVDRAADASGNERVAGLGHAQADLLRRAAARYTAFGRKLLG